MARKKFDTLGVMVDMSRNSVMTMDTLKRFLPLIKKMGYNCLMLYTEDTYEVENEPHLGYMRGKYTMKQMKEIDAYAASLGMDVIPCVQTLAHLYQAVKWQQLNFDCNDILLVDDERTYEFIDHIFATLSKCFRSKRVHVGMDEAHMLGRGKYLEKHGYEPSYSIMQQHIAKVREIAKKYDYEIMIWSDMYFSSWHDGEYYVTEKVKMPEDVVASYHDDVIPVYWDYYHTNQSDYEAMIYNHHQLSKNTWFAGGAWGWSGLIPHNQYSLNSMLPAIRACRKMGVRNIIMTMWGDCGGEGSQFARLPALHYIAEYAKGNEDDALIKAKFKRLTGIEFDDFMKIDLPNQIQGYMPKVNPSRYMLYADYFNDFLDYTVKPGVGDKYHDFARDLHEVARKSRRYGYIFKTAAKLCEVLAVKYELGLKTRRAYEAGDKEALKKLAENDYVLVMKKIREYADAYEKQWMYDNHPSGFDVQALRIGGILYRTEICRKRILDYVKGKLERIDELHEKILPLKDKEAEMPAFFAGAESYMTPNVLL